MKAVFPCKGVVVLAKHNVDTIKNYYEGTLIDSKLFATYNQNNFAIQVRKFNYLPQNSKIVLDENAHLLTIKDLNAILSQKVSTPQEKGIDDNEPIEDNFILNHPFFETLKPLN